MAGRTYENFDLVIEELSDALYRARVTSSIDGDMPSSRFRLPFDERDLQLLMLRLDPGRHGFRRLPASPHAQAAKDFGGPLFESVFSGDVMVAWRHCQQVARDHDHSVRLRLRLRDAPAIAGLPWELLYDHRTNSFLAQSERTPIVRHLDTGIPNRPMAVSGPLRILAVISSPTDLPDLDVEREWRRLEDALKERTREGSVSLDRLPQPTLPALGRWLRHHDVHILHFIGHGDFDPRLGDGVVYFCDEYGRKDEASPTTLGPYLQDHEPLRLVLLNACQTGRGGVDDAFGGMAQGLVQKQIDAVVAMQFPISDGAAATFTEEFYGAVADGLPVDQASTSARKAMVVKYGDEWATPVLFMRSSDGGIFTGIRAQADPNIAEPLRESPNQPPDSRSSSGSTVPPLQAPPQAPPQSPSQSPPQSPPRSPPQPSLQRLDQQPPPRPVPRDSRAVPPRGSPGRAHNNRRGLAITLVLAVIASVMGGLYYWRTRDGSTLTGPKIGAVHMTTPPTLDGSADDWPSTAITIKSDRLVVGDKQFVQATCGLGWDDNYLYLIAKVIDPVLTQTHAGDTSQLDHGDGVNFEIGTPNPQNGNTVLEPGDKHVLIGVDNGRLLGAINVASGTTFTKSASSISGLEGVSAGIPGGYLIEAAIPWPSLGLARVKAGAQMGLNVNVSDAIPEGVHKGDLRDMVSNNSDRKGNNAAYRSRWGTLTLQG